jgi:hypothetical protein
MAKQVTISQSVQAVAKLQTNPGAPAYGTGGTDDLPLLEPVVIQPRPQLIPISVIRGSLSPIDAVVGPQLADVRARFPVFGSGTAGSVTGNGAAAIDAMLIAAGMARHTQTARIIYRPATPTELIDGATTPGRCHPVTVGCKNGKARIYARDVVGSLTISGRPEGFLEGTFDGAGVWDTQDEGSFTGYTGGIIRPVAFRNVTLRIARITTPVRLTSATAGTTTTFTTDANHGLSAGQLVAITGLTGAWQVVNGCHVVTGAPTTTQFTIAYDSTGFGSLTGDGQAGGGSFDGATSGGQTIVLREFSFDAGNERQVINDATVSQGALRPIITGRNPVVRATMAVDRDTLAPGRAVPDATMLSEMFAGTKFCMRIDVGSATGNKWIFHFPRMAISIEYSERENIIMQTIQGRCTGGIESEYAIWVE